MLVTLLVSKLLTFNVVKLLQLLNMSPISVALLVLKLLISRLVNFEHPINILTKLVALDVFQFDISIFSKLVQFSNIPPYEYPE